MGSVVYQALIFIFLLGAGISYFNNVDGHGTSLYGNVILPDSGMNTSDTNQATVLNQALVDTSKDSGLNYAEMLSIIGSTVFGGLTAMFSLGFILKDMGVPAPMIVWVLSPLGIVLVFWLIEMWTGRPAE